LSRATMRSSSDFSVRSRQPMQVRTGADTETG
jgi:hypothetical protein